MNRLSSKMITVLVLSLVLTTADALYPKTHMTVADVIVGDGITVHCYSKDDDLGVHRLAYLESFSWSFRYSLIGDTKFHCDISSQYGSGNYEVYNRYIMVNRCGLNCLWQVQAGGPCLQQSHGPLWCLPWQKKRT